MSWPNNIPYVNPDVRYLGVSSLRKMNQQSLEKLEHPIVLKKENGEELAVLLPWRTFLALQTAVSEEPREVKNGDKGKSS